MEAVVLHGSIDQSISPYKSHLRNPKKIHYSSISRPSENFLPSHFHTTGILQAPPPFLSQSFPPYSLQQSPQPPLLPLPAANPRRSAASRGLSCPPVNKKASTGNRTRDSSLTPKKPKSPSKSSPKKGEKNPAKKSPEYVIVTSASHLGPDPKELPKDVAKVLPLISSGILHSNANNCINTNSFGPPKAVEDQVDMFSGSVAFTVSPPPSSLPLPTFSLRPKLSCNAEAAGEIDTGATDNLRRLLRLR